ncbi:hypothetical protein ABUW04_09405 [Streptacidiphilus sp. N1-10]|uniref:GATA-type domain-containing protein n=1 Tax=Streptacidiphilus jeojiensis TaxID=3229225 RepID=A0ABV6XJQ6_9ACTN
MATALTFVFGIVGTWILIFYGAAQHDVASIIFGAFLIILAICSGVVAAEAQGKVARHNEHRRQAALRAGWRECRFCAGTGIVTTYEWRRNGPEPFHRSCRTCNQYGWFSPSGPPGTPPY